MHALWITVNVGHTREAFPGARVLGHKLLVGKHTGTARNALKQSIAPEILVLEAPSMVVQDDSEWPARTVGLAKERVIRGDAVRTQQQDGQSHRTMICGPVGHPFEHLDERKGRRRLRSA